MADRRIDQLAPATQVNASDLFVIEQNNIAKQVAASNIGTAVMRSNPNLLDNWYFGNPVNQRTMTSWSSKAEYTIDRWYYTFYKSGTKSMSLTPGGITLSNSDSESGAYNEVVQFLEKDISNALIGKTVTISVLTDRGLLTNSGKLTSGSYMYNDIDNVTLYVRARSGDTADVRIRLKYGSSIVIYAAKVEIGSHQTLAHQENGVWVLNEIPDYGEQLRRCRRFYIPSTNRWDIAFYAVGDGINYPLPFESMRCQPSLSTTTTQVFDAVKGWVDITGAVCRYGDNGKMAIVWNGLSNLSTPYQSVYLVGNNTPALIADL